MSFSLSGTTITQSGTDANLSGLSSILGANYNSFGSGTKIYRTAFFKTQKLVISGTLTIDASTDILIFGTGVPTQFLTCTGTLKIVDKVTSSSNSNVYGRTAIKSLKIDANHYSTAQGLVFSGNGKLSMDGGFVDLISHINFTTSTATFEILSKSFLRLGTAVNNKFNLVRFSSSQANVTIDGLVLLQSSNAFETATISKLNNYSPQFSAEGIMIYGGLALGRITLNSYNPLFCTKDFAFIGSGSFYTTYGYPNKPVTASVHFDSRISGSGGGWVEIRKKLSLNFQDKNSANLQNIKTYIVDINNSARYNKIKNYTANFTYNFISNSSGIGTSDILLANVQVSPAQNVGQNSVPRTVDYRTKTNDGSKYDMDMKFFSYLQKYELKSSINFGGLDPTFSEKYVLQEDSNITEKTVATVKLYTELDTSEKLYDYAKSHLYDNYSGQTSTYFTKNGKILNLGSLNLEINKTATSIFEVTSTKITIKADVFTGSLKTTGAITLLNGSTINGAYQDSRGKTSQITLKGLINSCVLLVDEMNSKVSYTPDFSGDKIFRLTGETEKHKLLVCRAGYVKLSFDFLTDGALSEKTIVYSQLLDVDGSPMYTGSSSPNISFSYKSSSKKITGILSGNVSAPEFFDSLEDFISTETGGLWRVQHSLLQSTRLNLSFSGQFLNLSEFVNISGAGKTIEAFISSPEKPLDITPVGGSVIYNIASSKKLDLVAEEIKRITHKLALTHVEVTEKDYKDIDTFSISDLNASKFSIPSGKGTRNNEEMSFQSNEILIQVPLNKEKFIDQISVGQISISGGSITNLVMYVYITHEIKGVKSHKIELSASRGRDTITSTQNTNDLKGFSLSLNTIRLYAINSGFSQYEFKMTCDSEINAKIKIGRLAIKESSHVLLHTGNPISANVINNDANKLVVREGVVGLSPTEKAAFKASTSASGTVDANIVSVTGTSVVGIEDFNKDIPTKKDSEILINIATKTAGDWNIISRSSLEYTSLQTFKTKSTASYYKTASLSLPKIKAFGSGKNFRKVIFKNMKLVSGTFSTTAAYPFSISLSTTGSEGKYYVKKELETLTSEDIEFLISGNRGKDFTSANIGFLFLTSSASTQIEIDFDSIEFYLSSASSAQVDFSTLLTPISSIKLNTDKMKFTSSNDIKATLDGEQTSADIVSVKGESVSGVEDFRSDSKKEQLSRQIVISDATKDISWEKDGDVSFSKGIFTSTTSSDKTKFFKIKGKNISAFATNKNFKKFVIADFNMIQGNLSDTTPRTVYCFLTINGERGSKILKKQFKVLPLNKKLDLSFIFSSDLGQNLTSFEILFQVLLQSITDVLKIQVGSLDFYESFFLYTRNSFLKEIPFTHATKDIDWNLGVTTTNNSFNSSSVFSASRSGSVTNDAKIVLKNIAIFGANRNFKKITLKNFSIISGEFSKTNPHPLSISLEIEGATGNKDIYQVFKDFSKNAPIDLEFFLSNDLGLSLTKFSIFLRFIGSTAAQVFTFSVKSILLQEGSFASEIDSQEIVNLSQLDSKFLEIKNATDKISSVKAKTDLIDDVKTQTDKMQFTSGNDIKATLDSESVVLTSNVANKLIVRQGVDSLSNAEKSEFKASSSGGGSVDLSTITKPLGDIKAKTDKLKFQGDNIKSDIQAVKNVSVTNVGDFKSSNVDFSTVTTPLAAVQAKTDKLNFVGDDIKATLDSEKVVIEQVHTVQLDEIETEVKKGRDHALASDVQTQKS